MKRVDLILLISIIVISLFGLLMIYSASYVWAEYKFGNQYKFVITQGVFLVIGYIIMFITLKVPYMKYLKYANMIFGVCVLL